VVAVGGQDLTKVAKVAKVANFFRIVTHYFKAFSMRGCQHESCAAAVVRRLASGSDGDFAAPILEEGVELGCRVRHPVRSELAKARENAMLGLFASNPAVSMLKDDHEQVKSLFDQFEKVRTRSAKVRLVREALTELKVHAAIEEELFYPAVRRTVGGELMNEADEEHHVAKLLIAELDGMDGTESHFVAKFTVLGEMVRHHIKEEENEMLPKAREAKLDFEALAEKMQRRRDRLKAKGTPPVAEEKMVKAAKGRGDSPAMAAKRKPPKVRRG
jgi:hemerythrin-like domain-containing protein